MVSERFPRLGQTANPVGNPSGKELARWPIDGYVAALAALPRTSRLALAADNEIWLFDLRDGKRLGQLSGHRAPIITLAVTSMVSIWPVLGKMVPC
jgi:hypothetical protein